MPLVLTTVIVHVLGLGLIRQKTLRISSRAIQCCHPTTVFSVGVGLMTLLAIILHAIEAGIWAASYRFLGALPDNKSAMLYSLNAMTSYGHTNLTLEHRWQLMGAIEALNGWLLFGLTAAFLFAVIERIQSLTDRSLE